MPQRIYAIRPCAEGQPKCWSFDRHTPTDRTMVPCVPSGLAHAAVHIR